MKRAAAVVALGVSLAFAAGAPAQQLYKWTDEKGVVHYTDKAPPDARGSTVLDKQGRQVGKIEAAPTPEQARAKQAEEERQKAAAKEQESTARRDRALMQSYTSESEIELARARTVATYESQIQSAQAYLGQLTKRKQELDLRKSKFASDKPLPPQLEHDSANVDAEFAKNRDLVAQKQRDLAAVNARYEADKTRWRELAAMEAASPAKSATAPPVGAAPAPKK